MLNTPYTEWAGDEVHGRHQQVKDVWIDLDVLFSQDPEAPIHNVPDGLNLQGQVRGQLSGWFRSHLGAWLAVVNYDIPYRDERRNTVRVTDQLVPRDAVAPTMHVRRPGE